MSSTYSTNLAIELIGSGEQAGTWGTTTNTNLGTLIEQAISGIVTQAITDGADTVITIPNGATGVARNMVIECTGSLTAARNLIVPANKKLYFIYNNTTGGYAVTVKVSGQTGVSVPNGAKVILMMNSAGTDIVSATNYQASLTLGSALAVASGGTGATSITSGALVKGAGTGALSAASAADIVSAIGSTAVTNATNATSLTSTLSVAGGGTGSTTLTANNVLLGNGTSALQAVAPGTTGNVLTSNGTTWTSSAPASGVTSFIGQTGAVDPTVAGALGSVLFGCYIVTSPYANNNTTTNGAYSVLTTAGSNIAYNISFTTSTGAAGVAPGQYFYRVHSGGYSTTQPFPATGAVGSNIAVGVSTSVYNTSSAFNATLTYTTLSGSWRSLSSQMLVNINATGCGGDQTNAYWPCLGWVRYA